MPQWMLLNGNDFGFEMQFDSLLIEMQQLRKNLILIDWAAKEIDIDWFR